MNAFIEIIEKLVSKIDAQTWLKQPHFPFQNLKNSRGKMYDICLFEVNATGAWGFLILKFDDTIELMVFPFRLARYQEKADLITILPWSLREASFDSRMYEIWRSAQKNKNPLITYNKGLFYYKKSSGNVGFLMSGIWSDSTSICVRLDFQIAYKIFKVLNPENPISSEVEILEYLNTQNHFTAYPKIVNTYEYVAPDQTKYHLGIGMKYIPNEGTLFPEFVSLVQQLKLSPPNSSSLQLRLYRQFEKNIQNLGRLIADFHYAMSQVPRQHILAAEPNKQNYIQKWKEHFIFSLEKKSLKFLEFKNQFLEYSEIFSKIELLKKDYVEKLVSFEDFGLFIKIHGNIHIGKILISDQNLILLDFDSSSQNLLDYKNNKDPCFKEIASVICSLYFSWFYSEFKYFSTLKNKIENDPTYSNVTKIEELQNLSLDFIIQIFMKFYLGALDENIEISHLLPTNNSSHQELISLFIFDRLIYQCVRSQEHDKENTKIWLQVFQFFISKIKSVDIK